ncbi:MAG: hydroxyphenylacetyl-CoA thioesterase PaaI [Glaciimonas sp.]|nr:hydroxyphenylacetyl-CoA thioesterase PaaI [Glaciimonas sp.]
MNGMRILLPIDPQALAQAVVNALFARDQASHTLGMQLAAAAPGYVRVTMTVRPDMLNGLGACHGGFIFTLADSAFALACNSYNQNTVASGCIIDFLAPGRLGELLTAEAVEQSLSGRVGVYDITVTNQNGKRIALFRGRSYRINGEVIDAAALPTPLDG